MKLLLPLGGLAATAALLAGCNGDSATLHSVDGLNLLARSPDQVVEQPGAIAVDEDELWGEYALDGWMDYTESSPDGYVYAWCKQPIARLRLPATAPLDRHLVLRAKVDKVHDEDDTEPIVAKVRLNGLSVGQITLDAALRQHEVPTKAIAWQPGDNVLEVEVERMRRGMDGAHRGVAMAQVRYGESHRVEVDNRNGRAELAPGTGLVYRLELLAPSTIVLRGESSGRGRLEVRYALLDTETGITGALSDPPLSVPVDGDGRLEAELPLPPPEGKVVHVELSWRDAGGSDLDLTGILLREEGEPERTPIVFISIDTLAARNLSIYGYERHTTPELEELARESVLFTQARSNAPFTLQSYMSQLSGLYPTANRLEWKRHKGRPPTPWEKDSIAPNRWTMAEMLRAAGYRTGGWVDNPWLSRGFGFSQGFDHYDISAAEIELWKKDGGIYHIAPRVLDWVDDLGPEEPFFAFIQSFDPHGPYLPDPPFEGMFHGDEHYDAETEETVGVHQLHAFGLIPEYIARGAQREGELPARMNSSQFIAAYDEKIAQMDARLGQLFDELKERGIYDRALIIVSADHGESMLEHDYFFDHGTIYDEVIHVPLIVRMPGGAHGGRVVDDRVQLVDLYATLLDVAGLPPREWMHGRSILPILDGRGLEPLPVLCEGGIMDQAMVVDGDYKLIEYSAKGASWQTVLTHKRFKPEWIASVAPELLGKLSTLEELNSFFNANFQLKKALGTYMAGPFYELYDIVEDPHETHDLSEAMPDKVEELRAIMRRLEERGEIARNHASISPPVEMSPEMIAELQALGYISGDD